MLAYAKAEGLEEFTVSDAVAAAPFRNREIDRGCAAAPAGPAAFAAAAQAGR